MSVAIANVANPIATLQTLPLLLPAVDLDKFNGFFTQPVKQNSPLPPKPYSSIASLDNKTAPSFCKISYAVALYVGIKFFRNLLPAVVKIFFVQILSFNEYGIP